MVYIGSTLKCMDNSGALTVKCLKIYKKSFRGRGEVGDTVLVSIKTYRSNRKVKKGELYKGILMRIKKQFKRYGDIYFGSENNTVILLDNRALPLGSRVLGPAMREVRRKSSSLINASTILV